MRGEGGHRDGGLETKEREEGMTKRKRGRKGRMKGRKEFNKEWKGGKEGMNWLGEDTRKGGRKYNILGEEKDTRNK